MPNTIQSNSGSNPYLGNCTFLLESQKVVDGLVDVLITNISNHQKEKNNNIPVSIAKGLAGGYGLAGAAAGTWFTGQVLNSAYAGETDWESAKYAGIGFSVTAATALGLKLLLNRKTTNEKIFKLWGDVANGLLTQNGEAILQGVVKIKQARKDNEKVFKETISGLQDAKFLVALHHITAMGYISRAIKLFQDQNATVEQFASNLNHAVKHLVYGKISANDASMLHFQRSFEDLFRANKAAQIEAMAEAKVESEAVPTPAVA